MSTCYIESSALLAWALGEAQRDQVLFALNNAEKICTSRLTFTECNRCIRRLATPKEISTAEMHKLWGWFSLFEREWDVMEISYDVHKTAHDRFPVEPIRTLDSIHLATMLQFHSVYDELSCLSFDKRILENLPGMGIKQWN